MKILQINCVYNKGSTGRIMSEIHKELIKNGHESLIFYGRGGKTTDANVVKVCSELYAKINHLFARLTGIMYGGCFFATNRIISLIKKEKPDVVHLHCINGYFVNIYRLVSWLKNNNIPTVLTLHAEFMHTANCSHAFDCNKWKTGCGKCPNLKAATRSLLFDRTHNSWVKMKKAFYGFENLTVVSVSPWLMDRAKQSPILKDNKHVVILNGLDTNVFSFRKNDAIKKELNLENKKVVFHATPNFNDDKTHIKGGYYVLKLAKMMPDVNFLVAGKYDESLNGSKNVFLLGNVSNAEKLAEYYSVADVTVIASKRETFSMIVAESLSCGTPVVGFKAGAPEQITIKEYSEFVEYGDVESLSNALLRLLNPNFSKSEISEKAKMKYSNEKMSEKYIDEYKNLLTK